MLAATGVMTGLIAGCGAESQAAAPPTRGGLWTAYHSADGERNVRARDFLRHRRLPEQIAERLNKRLSVRTRIGIVGRACGDSDVSYDPEKGRIDLCYEFVDEVRGMFSERAESAVADARDGGSGSSGDSHAGYVPTSRGNLPGARVEQTTDLGRRATTSRKARTGRTTGLGDRTTDPGDRAGGDLDERTAGVVTETLYHEIAHALIDRLDLPIVGREEDVADQFAAYNLVPQGARGRAALLAAADNYTLYAERTDPQDIDYSDEHLPDAARSANYRCYLYGAAPGRERALVDGERLTKARAELCEDEYHDLRRGWTVLLAPYRTSR
ncbi:hypothetical protein ACZ90_32075 [Streptomyces albus subsp. albus]|nr:hypothetical protein ACZ90_32075 [Streptomyces albus subsp. albus]